MIFSALVRVMYALFFGGMVAYVAQGLFHDGWVSAGFGVMTAAAFGAWSLHRALTGTDRPPRRMPEQTESERELRRGVSVTARLVRHLLGIPDDALRHDCPRDTSGYCGMPRHMNW
ncbi:hypothetical protein [Streptomyces sp. NPDC102360]|uniref:hypothetical protein n=1 Tax=Streptomyces sp. NPDC102360 TaxID=3366160 RepID=UPI00380C56BC